MDLICINYGFLTGQHQIQISSELRQQLTRNYAVHNPEKMWIVSFLHIFHFLSFKCDTFKWKILFNCQKNVLVSFGVQDINS